MTIAKEILTSKTNLIKEVKEINKVIAGTVDYTGTATNELREYRDLLIDAIQYVQKKELIYLEE